MNASVLLLLAAMCQDDGSEYYKFKPGTEWVYLQVDRDSRKITKMRVKEEKDGKTICDSADYEEGATEPARSETVALYVKDGLLRFAQVENGEVKDLFVVLKVDGKKGDKWKSLLMDDKTEAEVEHLGTEDVVVLKGDKAEKTYKDAVHTQLKMSVEQEGMKMEFVADYYFVKGIGLVKMKMKGSQGVEMNLDLKEFTPVK